MCQLKTQPPGQAPLPWSPDPATFPMPQCQRLHSTITSCQASQLPASAPVEMWAAGRAALPSSLPPTRKKGWKLPRWSWASTSVRTCHVDVAPPQPHCSALTLQDTHGSPACHPWVLSWHFAAGCRLQWLLCTTSTFQVLTDRCPIPRHGHSSCPALPAAAWSLLCQRPNTLWGSTGPPEVLSSSRVSAVG